MSAEYAFDLYPRDDPKDGTRLVRYTYEDLIAAEYRDVIGVGSGQATMWADHAGAEFVDVRGEQYARVVRLGGVEAVVGGIWTSKLPFETAVASEQRHLTISGPGTMAYLARARMAPHTYIHDLFIGQDPFDGMWRLFAQGLGNTLGAILYRVIYEAQHFRDTPTYTHEHGDNTLNTDSHADDRLESRIPELVMGFDNTDDSNGNPWTLTSGDFTAQVGENVLGIVQRLMQAGLSLWMDPDDFTLYAWEGRPATKLGRSTDRTGVAWAADVVRFQYPTDATLATGNVLSETTRVVNSYLPQGPIWVGGNDIYHLETGPADALYEGFVPSGVEDLTALANIGAAQSTAKVEAADVGQVKHRLGDDEATGAYLPGEHYRLDELVRVNTGTGEFDYDEDDYPVGAWRVSLPEGGAEWEAFADLGASYEEAQRREFAISATPGHTHPPNPQLCRKDAAINTSLAWKALEHASLAGGEINPEPADWKEVGFDDSAWATPFISASNPSAMVDIEGPNSADFLRRHEFFFRREFYITANDLSGADVAFDVYADDGAIVYVNGATVATLGTQWNAGPVTLNTTLARSAFVAGLNCIAIYVWNQEAGTDGTAPNPGGTIAGLRIAIPAASHYLGTDPRAKRCDDVMHAALVPIVDLGDHFDSTNVEGALQELGAGGAGVTDHGALTGLADDDHTQYVKDSEFGAKGRILVGTGSGTFDDLPVGTDGDVLVADSGETTGVKWETGSGAVPRLWHHEPEHRFRIFAHRGDINPIDGYPENTLEGIRQAALRGVDGSEYDVVRSSDGTWWLMHDNDLSRTTDGSGNIDATTDATIAALNIDGGYGYDAGRHGTSLNVPTLDSVLDAIRPYNFVSVLHLAATDNDAGHLALANYIVANDIADRVIVLVASLSGAALIKGVDPNIQVQALTPVTDDPQSEADVDQWLANHAELSVLSDVTSRAPEQVWSMSGVDDIPDDETAWIEEAWEFGSVAWMSNDLPVALAVRMELLGAGSVTEESVRDAGRWEVMMADGVSSPPDPLQNEAGTDWLYGWTSG